MAQQREESVVVDTDLPSLLFRSKGMPKDTSIKVNPRKLSLAPLPVVGFNPANGFVVGGALSAATLLGDAANTRQSSGLLNVTVTSKRQIIFIARAGISLPKNNLMFDGDLRYLIFTQDTYGLGTRVGRKGAPNFAVPQPMDFNYLRVYLNAFKRISSNLYGGVGLGIDWHNSIEDKWLKPDSLSVPSTYHSDYNDANGFPLKAYKTNGYTLSLKWDSRDNIANPHNGWFVSGIMRHNTTWLGSQRNSFGISFDGRYYLKLNRRRPGNLVAFWLRGDFFKEGQLPYLALPSLGWDTYNRTGRGYIQGRFRGHSMVYFESEYRFPILANGLLGGVVFSNVTSASGNGQRLLHTLAPAYGGGIRIKLDKLARTNISIDYGRGMAGSSGIFFNLQEAF